MLVPLLGLFLFCIRICPFYQSLMLHLHGLPACMFYFLYLHPQRDALIPTFMELLLGYLSLGSDVLKSLCVFLREECEDREENRSREEYYRDPGIHI